MASSWAIILASLLIQSNLQELKLRAKQLISKHKVLIFQLVFSGAPRMASIHTFASLSTMKLNHNWIQDFGPFPIVHVTESLRVLWNRWEVVFLGYGWDWRNREMLSLLGFGYGYIVVWSALNWAGDVGGKSTEGLSV